MDWLSLCVCGAKGDLADEKAKKAGKGKPVSNKKSKKSRKCSKRKGSCKGSPPSIDESSRGSQDGHKQSDEEITGKKWTNGEIVNCREREREKSQIVTIDQDDPAKLSEPLNNARSHRLENDRNDDEESRKDSESNVDESGRETRDINHDDDDDDDMFVSHSRSVSSTTDEDAEQEVKYTSDENADEEELELDDPTTRSAISVEREDSSWTSEMEDKSAAMVRPSFERKLEERTSSRINFSRKEREIFRTTASSRKESRNALPPIKKRSRAEARNCTNNEEQQANKFGFKKDAVVGEHRETHCQRKLNSCSFEIRPFEMDEERSRKTRIRAEGSMIPRLASPMRQELSSFKNDTSGVVQNGTLLYAYRISNKV